jgi:hypothetical protein
MATVNYGAKIGTVSGQTVTPVGVGLTVVTKPSLSKEVIPVRSHDDGGKTVFIASNRKGEYSPFTATWYSAATIVTSLIAKINSNSSLVYEIEEPNGEKTDFTAFVTKIDYDAMPGDGTNAGLMKVTATFQPFETPSATWYADVIAIYASCGGELALADDGEYQLIMYAVTNGGTVFAVSAAGYADIGFDSSSEAAATVSATGLVEGVAGGTTYINAHLTSDATICTTINVTVS